MSWYAPYKKTVDFFLSSVMWVVFSWNLFQHLPNLINGAGSFSNSASSIKKEMGGDE